LCCVCEPLLVNSTQPIPPITLPYHIMVGMCVNGTVEPSMVVASCHINNSKPSSNNRQWQHFQQRSAHTSSTSTLTILLLAIIALTYVLSPLYVEANAACPCQLPTAVILHHCNTNSTANQSYVFVWMAIKPFPLHLPLYLLPISLCHKQ
jgi:hypothetical protein